MAAAAAARAEAKKNNPQASNKKRKTSKKTAKASNHDVSTAVCGDCNEDEIDEKAAVGKKKRAPFTRKAPLEGRTRAYKIRMVLTTQQKQELKVCFAAARGAYNFANALIKYEDEPASVISIRKKWYAKQRPEWSSKVARRFEAGAIKDCVTAHTTNIEMRIKNPKHHYNVKNRSLQHSKTESLDVESSNVVLKIEPLQVSGSRAECLMYMGNNMARTGGIRLQDSKRVIGEVVKLGKNLHAGGRIQWVKNTDSFYYIWTYPQPLLIDEDALFERKRIAALDPGMAPFQEWYSPTSGEHGTLLTDAKISLKTKCLAIDRLRSRVDRRKGHADRPTTRRCQAKSRKKQKHQRRKTTRRLKKKLARDCARLRGYVCHGHYSAARFLLEKHDIVIAPILATQRLTTKKHRCFGSAMARGMYTWSHRLFRQRLAYAAARYPGRHVFECGEPGTSGTCTLCGHWNDALRLGDKVCRCPSCGVCVDRQLAGARNNFWAAYGMARGVGWDGVGG
jgi:transposase